ncbi:MAG TPA: hypothetical protein VM328_03375 [Fimbriimonadaceae bacterium]|nr:hypothetical protein [Fimbriimonadaceae bacterium]
MKRWPLVALTIPALAAGGWYLGGWSRPRVSPPQPKYFDGRIIPPEGLVVNPRGVDPGDPANAEKDFRRFYQAIVQYRARHGRFPQVKELLDFSKPIVPGGIQLTAKDWDNPDAEKADLPRRRDWCYGYNLPKVPRPNGAPKPVFPKPGERDVWMDTGFIYTRMNEVAYPDGRRVQRPSGCHVVLWSDGKIERIPFGEMRLFPRDLATRSYYWTYPGQTGLPENTISQREFELSFNSRKGKLVVHGWE